MALTRDDVVAALRPLLPTLERLRDEVRVVGTASSLLRGIALPAADVDVLAREATIVDALVAAAETAAGARAVSAAGWVEQGDLRQYLAEVDIAGVAVQFSTVEPGGDPPAAGRIAECTGFAPWRYFDVLEVEGFRVAVVATELRLLSEVVRLRLDRVGPLGAALAAGGYDAELLAAAAEQRLGPHRANVLRASLGLAGRGVGG